jgi:hypothetical protein
MLGLNRHAEFSSASLLDPQVKFRMTRSVANTAAYTVMLNLFQHLFFRSSSQVQDDPETPDQIRGDSLRVTVHHADL